MALADTDPEGNMPSAPPSATPLAEPSTVSYDEPQVLYIAAAAGENLRNGTMQHVLRIRPRAVCHEVEGDHFDFLQRSATEVAQLVNEFLLGATALLG